MNDMRYFGQYMPFKTKTKREGLFLTNADNLIGDEYTISFEVEEGRTVAWLINRFGDKVGFFSPSDTYTLDVYRAREWNLHALLSLVLFTDEHDDQPGAYWGEMAVIACPNRYEEEISTYIEGLKAELAKGVRPEVDLTVVQIDEMLAKGGNWISSDHRSSWKQEKGTVVMKESRSLLEGVIEEGRKGNVGCYIVSYAFIAALVIGAGYLAAKFFGLL